MCVLTVVHAQPVNTGLDALGYYQELANLVMHALLDNIDQDALECLVARVLPVIHVLWVSIDLHVQQQIQALALAALHVSMVFTYQAALSITKDNVSNATHVQMVSTC